MSPRSLTMAAALLVALTTPSTAAASGLQPIDLRVDGGEEAWHAEPRFAIRWSNPPGTAAVHYRLLDPTGETALTETRVGWAATAIDRVAVPPTPGIYTGEVWLEDGAGGEGPPASAKLRFDDGAPRDVAPVEPERWLGRADFPFVLRIRHPGDPQPLAGIRGYAISIDREPDGAPCEEAVACSEAETDLQGGAGADALELANLPEGLSYAHAVAVSSSGVHSPRAGTVSLRVDETDPVTLLSGNREGWSRVPLTLVATATDGGSGMVATEGSLTPFTAVRVDGGAPTVEAGDRASTTVIESGAHTVAFYARDAAGNVDDGGLVNGIRNRAPRTALVRIDRDPPTLSFSNSQDPSEPERVDARVADALSGADPATGQISVRLAGSSARYEPLPTRTSGSTISALWSSEAYPPGEYEFRAAVRDRAGNASSTVARDNGGGMRLRNPIKVQTHIAAELETAGTPARCRQSVSFAGRLTAGRRAPLPDMPIRVVERFAPGSSRKDRITIARSGDGGRFRVRLHPGPSREVSAEMPAAATLQSARSTPRTLPVRACVSLHASSPVARVGGRPVVFRGRVRTAAAVVPAEGLPVQLQFRAPGLAWSEFRTVQTDRHGGFRYPYRFADDDSRGVRFRFRAFVAARAGWPFEPAGSSPVEVRGR